VNGRERHGKVENAIGVAMMQGGDSQVSATWPRPSNSSFFFGTISGYEREATQSSSQIFAALAKAIIQS
jgi:hypothetical protein